MQLRSASTSSGIERFDAFVERCLYGPDGFYASGGTAGRGRGDFLTSPEVGPLFGAVIFCFVDDVWNRAGQPDSFSVYDVGCGPGALLRSVAVAADDAGGRPWRLIGIDRVDAAGAQAQELPQDLSSSVVLANELLDNLPFRIVERQDSGELRELAVETGSGAETLIDTDLVATGPLDIPIGSRAPVHEQADAWVRGVLDRGPTAVALFDYGAPHTVDLAQRGEWLRTYRGHDRGHDPLVEPGSRDITTDVGWDQLPEPGRLEHQSEFLKRWGIDGLIDEGRSHWKAHAARPDLRAMRMRSRVTEAGALLDSDALGLWWVASWELGPFLSEFR